MIQLSKSLPKSLPNIIKKKKGSSSVKVIDLLTVKVSNNPSYWHSLFDTVSKM